MQKGDRDARRSQYKAMYLASLAAVSEVMGEVIADLPKEMRDLKGTASVDPCETEFRYYRRV